MFFVIQEAIHLSVTHHRLFASAWKNKCRCALQILLYAACVIPLGKEVFAKPEAKVLAALVSMHVSCFSAILYLGEILFSGNIST